MKWSVAGHPFNDVEFFSIFPTEGAKLWAAGGLDLPYIAAYKNIYTEYEGEYIILPVKLGIIRSLYFTSEDVGWAIGADFSEGVSNPKGLILKYENLEK